MTSAKLLRLLQRVARLFRLAPAVTRNKHDRRPEVRAAAARVRGSFSSEFQVLGADEVMRFIRGDDVHVSVANPAQSTVI